MKRTLFVGLLVLIVITLPSAHAAPQRQKAKASDLVFAIELPRTEYLEGEPVIATVSLTNSFKEKRRLAEPTRDFDLVRFYVTPESKTTKMPAIWMEHFAGVPEDYGWEFNPNEARRSQYDLQLSFMDSLPVGNYKVHAVYKVPSWVRDVWRGKIVTPDVSFSVVEPSSQELSAVISLKDAQAKRKSDKALESAKAFGVLKERSFAGRLADYAGFWEASAYGMAGDHKNYRNKLEDYVKEHSNVPYYGARAIEVLATELCRQGDYQSAKEVLNRLPDSYMRQMRISWCTPKQLK